MRRGRSENEGELCRRGIKEERISKGMKEEEEDKEERKEEEKEWLRKGREVVVEMEGEGKREGGR